MSLDMGMYSLHNFRRNYKKAQRLQQE